MYDDDRWAEQAARIRDRDLEQDEHEREWRYERVAGREDVCRVKTPTTRRVGSSPKDGSRSNDGTAL